MGTDERFGVVYPCGGLVAGTSNLNERVVSLEAFCKYLEKERIARLEAFCQWLESEPPRILFWRWRKWKKNRPVLWEGETE